MGGGGERVEAVRGTALLSLSLSPPAPALLPSRHTLLHGPQGLDNIGPSLAPPSSGMGAKTECKASPSPPSEIIEVGIGWKGGGVS